MDETVLTQNPKLIRMLELHEDLRYKPYDDATGRELKAGDVIKGKITIGIGRNISDRGLALEECYVLLLNDLQITVGELMSNLPWFKRLDEVRQCVLIDMCFNMGWPTFSQFKRTLGFIESGDYSAAADSMMDSLWASQVRTRAARLATMMRTGQWYDEQMTPSWSA